MLQHKHPKCWPVARWLTTFFVIASLNLSPTLAAVNTEHRCLAKDSEFSRAEAIGGAKLNFSDTLALQAILRTLNNVSRTRSAAKQQKMLLHLNQALAHSRLKVLPFVIATHAGPRSEKISVTTIYLDGNPWKDAYLGWEKLSLDGCIALGMRVKDTKWLSAPDTKRVFLTDAVESVTPIAGPIFQINAMAYGTTQEAGETHVGGIEYFKKRIPGLVRSGYKNIYLVGLLPIGDLNRKMNRGERNEEDQGTRFYTVRDPATREVRMFIDQEWPGRDDQEGSPFGSENPRMVNPRWGAIGELIKLAKELRAQGVRLTVDLVPNHIGVDDPWLNDNWDATIHIDLSKKMRPQELEHLSDQELMARYSTGAFQCFVFYRKPGDKKSRIMIAHGRAAGEDKWVNTVQLDFTNEKARRYVLETIRFWASNGFSLRADMAHLVTKVAFKHQWYPHMRWEKFHESWPKDFWEEVRDSIMPEHPDFVLMMEAYGPSVGYLAGLHPRIAVYDMDLLHLFKKYEIRDLHEIEHLKDRLIGTPLEMQRKLIHFLMNHDEKSAREEFGVEFQKLLAVYLATIPGIPFVHYRQSQGLLYRLHIEQWIPFEQDIPSPELERFYDEYLPTLEADPLFRAGGIYVLHSDNPHIMAYTRSYKNRESVVVLNFASQRQQGTIPMAGYHVPFDLQPFGYKILPRDVAVSDVQREALQRSLDDLRLLGQAA